MADNLVLDPGSGGGTAATDEIGGIHYPRGKMGFGVDGAYVDASHANPFPVMGTANIAGTVPVSGTVGVSGTVPVSIPGTPTVNLNGTVPVTVAAIGTVAISGNVEVMNDAGNPLPVSWTSQNVGITGTVPVSVVGTVPVSGTVGVSGTVPVTVSGTANVNVTGGTVSVTGGTVMTGRTEVANRLQGTVILTNTTAGTLIASQGAGLRINVTTVTVANTGTVATMVTLQDGGTALQLAYLPAAANMGGAIATYEIPLYTGQAGTLLAVCQTAPAGGSVYVSAVGFKGA